MAEPAALQSAVTVPIREDHLVPRHIGATTLAPRRATLEIGFATVSSIAKETMGSEVMLLCVSVLKTPLLVFVQGTTCVKYQTNHKSVLIRLTGWRS